MRKRLVSLGLVLILIGAALAFLGPWREIVRVPDTFEQELTICDEELFYVDSDDYAVFSAVLGFNSSAEGYFKVYYGSLRFFVVDDENFQEWKDGNSPAVVLFEYEDAKTGKFELQFEEGGTYHFVFDNTGRQKEKKVYFTASARWVESGFTETIRENFTPVYVGIGVAILGVVVVILGLRSHGRGRSRYDEIRELWLGKESSKRSTHSLLSFSPPYCQTYNQ